jgi:hypothetical protein
MFSSAYQDGDGGLEIFSPAGNDPFRLMKLQNENSIIKVYDRNIKGYMISLDKESNSTSIRCPEKQRYSLGITQPLLVFQMISAPSKSFSLEIVIVDQSNQRRRLHFSTNFKSLDCNGLHCRIPYDSEKDIWMNLVFDLVDIVDQAFKNTVQFQSLESFTIHPVCRLRKIFTMQRKAIIDKNSVFIPVCFDFPPGVDRVNVVYDLQYKQFPVRLTSDISCVISSAINSDVLSLTGVSGMKVTTVKPQATAKVRAVSRGRHTDIRSEGADRVNVMGTTLVATNYIANSGVSIPILRNDHDVCSLLLQRATSVLCLLESSLSDAQNEYIHRYGRQSFSLEVDESE